MNTEPDFVRNDYVRGKKADHHIICRKIAGKVTGTGGVAHHIIVAFVILAKNGSDLAQEVIGLLALFRQVQLIGEPVAFIQRDGGEAVEIAAEQRLCPQQHRKLTLQKRPVGFAVQCFLYRSGGQRKAGGKAAEQLVPAGNDPAYKAVDLLYSALTLAFVKALPFVGEILKQRKEEKHADK